MNTGHGAARPRRWRTAIPAFLFMMACGDEAVGPGHLCGDPPELDVPSVEVGVLAPTDRTLDGSYVDYYSLRLDEAGLLRLTLSSSTMDPFLYLWRGDEPSPHSQAFDRSPSSGARVARLSTALEAGCYRVGASAWDPGHGGLGAYTLEAELLGTVASRGVGDQLPIE